MKKTAIRLAVASTAMAASVGIAFAQEPPTSHIALTASEVPWGDPPPSLNPGAKLAVVSGNPGGNGPFAIHLQLPAGYKIAPHWHPTVEHVTVLSGVLALGMGEEFDQTSTKELSEGGYALLPAEMRHFALAMTDVVVQVHGMGPFVLNYVNPADDPSQPTK